MYKRAQGQNIAKRAKAPLGGPNEAKRRACSGAAKKPPANKKPRSFRCAAGGGEQASNFIYKGARAMFTRFTVPDSIWMVCFHSI